MKNLLIGLTLLTSISAFAESGLKNSLNRDGDLLSNREFSEALMAVKEGKETFRGSNYSQPFCFISNKHARNQAKKNCIAYAIENDKKSSSCTELVTFTDGSRDYCDSISYYVID
jgi:hypothetical protein